MVTWFMTLLLARLAATAMSMNHEKTTSQIVISSQGGIVWFAWDHFLFCPFSSLWVVRSIKISLGRENVHMVRTSPNTRIEKTLNCQLRTVFG